MSFVPEDGHDHAHGHGTGVKWLDIMVGLSAMFISIVSLVVSIQHGRTMEEMVDQNERMVTANTLPLLQLFGSDYDDSANAPLYSYNLKNTGVGPAVIDWFDVRYKHESYGDPGKFLHACCMAPGSTAHVPDGIFYSNVSGTVLPARETTKLLVVTGKAPADFMSRLAQAKNDIDIRACYCSVMEQCWITDFGRVRPTHVASCPVPKDVNPW
jgi:hypothetical protein